MKFTEITASLAYPKKLKARMSSDHSAVIDYTIRHFKNTRPFKAKVIAALNSVSYAIICKDSYDMTAEDPIEALQLYEDEVIRDGMLDKYPELYINIEDVEWDITKAESDAKPEPTKSKSKSEGRVKPKKVEPPVETPKEWLYLRAPQYPRMDTSKVVLDTMVGGERFFMHPSLPIIPEKQADISCTTDVGMMTEKDLMKLYPNRLIHTRAESMYEPYGDIPMDKDLGLLLPVEGFTPEQFRENIIKYPHFYRLSRLINDKEVNFYNYIEIDGELHKISEVWGSLPDSKYIPKTTEFVKEYVIRRYLLERDNGVEHKYKLRGNLQPYITLFAPPEFYNTDPVELARTAVKARVEFLRSRNPFLERYEYVMKGMLTPYEGWNNDCPFKQYCAATECSTVCADQGEFSYLIERNGLTNNKSIFSLSSKALQDASECLTAAEECYKVVTTTDTSEVASCLTYAAICNYYKGNTYHCSVYHLNFAEYVNDLQKSWTEGTTDELEYTDIFIEKCKVLIISNIDFVQFKDFQAQTLLNIAHNRKGHKQSTIIVSPKLNSLFGSGAFFTRLKEVFGKELIKL